MPAVVIVVFLAWVGLLLVSMRLGYEDYLTSVLGYQAIPTRKTDEALAWFVGALPMLLQVAFGFWAIEKKSPLAFVITFAAFIIDAGTDVIYKASPLTIVGVAFASVETVLLYTLGTEFLFIASLENIVEYLPDAMIAVAVIGQRVGKGLGRLFDWLTGAQEDRHIGG